MLSMTAYLSMILFSPVCAPKRRRILVTLKRFCTCMKVTQLVCFLLQDKLYVFAAEALKHDAAHTMWQSAVACLADSEELL